jgi:hypothetical protein
LGPSKIYPNWDFWFEKKPSGIPVGDRSGGAKEFQFVATFSKEFDCKDGEKANASSTQLP